MKRFYFSFLFVVVSLVFSDVCLARPPVIKNCAKHGKYTIYDGDSSKKCPKCLDEAHKRAEEAHRRIVEAQQRQEELKRRREEEEREAQRRRAETQRRIDEETRKFNQLKRNSPEGWALDREYDKFKNIEYFSVHDEVPRLRTEAGNVWIELIAIHCDDGDAGIQVRACYRGDDWIFVHDVILMGPDRSKLTFGELFPRQDIIGVNDLYESINKVYMDRGVIMMLKSMLESGQVDVRYSCRNNNGSVVDWQMSKEQIAACLAVIYKYEEFTRE